MGLHKPTGLDSSIQNELGLQIRELAERIGHLKAYTNDDTGLLQLQLDALIDQHNEEINNGQKG